MLVAMLACAANQAATTADSAAPEVDDSNVTMEAQHDHYADLVITNEYVESLFAFAYVVVPHGEEWDTVLPEARIPEGHDLTVKNAIEMPRCSATITIAMVTESLGIQSEFLVEDLDIDDTDTLHIFYGWDIATAQFYITIAE